MFISILSYFLYDWISHVLASINSSGEQITGMAYPEFVATSLILRIMNGLLICLKFQVRMNSMSLIAATAMCNASSGHFSGIAFSLINLMANSCVLLSISNTEKFRIAHSRFWTFLSSPRDASSTTVSEMKTLYSGTDFQKSWVANWWPPIRIFSDISATR